MREIDTGLASFAIMASFFEKPISIEQIQHKYDRQNSKFEEYELLTLAKEFSLKAKFIDSNWDKLSKTQNLQILSSFQKKNLKADGMVDFCF